MSPLSCFSGDNSLDSDVKKTHRIPNVVPFTLRNEEADILATSESFENDFLAYKINDIHMANKVQTRIVMDEPVKLANISDNDARSLFSESASFGENDAFKSNS